MTTVPDQYLTFASFLAPLRSHWSLPLSSCRIYSTVAKWLVRLPAVIDTYRMLLLCDFVIRIKQKIYT
jgi:hypothetical protein